MQVKDSDKGDCMNMEEDKIIKKLDKLNDKFNKISFRYHEHSSRIYWEILKLDEELKEARKENFV